MISRGETTQPVQAQIPRHHTSKQGGEADNGLDYTLGYVNPHDDRCQILVNESGRDDFERCKPGIVSCPDQSLGDVVHRLGPNIARATLSLLAGSVAIEVLK